MTHSERYVVKISIGMEVMVTQNIQTDLDITNGAHSTIVDILLSPDKPIVSDIQATVKLNHLPLCILVKLNHTWATQLTDLDKPVIPVELASNFFLLH